MNVCKHSAESQGDPHFNILPECCLLKASQSIENSILKKIFCLENYTVMQTNVQTKISLKAMQELQRLASPEAEAKVPANILKRVIY